MVEAAVELLDVVELLEDVVLEVGLGELALPPLIVILEITKVSVGVMLGVVEGEGVTVTEPASPCMKELVQPPQTTVSTSKLSKRNELNNRNELSKRKRRKRSRSFLQIIFIPFLGFNSFRPPGRVTTPLIRL